MRPAPASAVLLLLLAGPCLAQTGKDVRVIKTPTAEVYSGPSTKSPFYVTNRLQKNDAIEVVESLPDGWLKIRPPAGSTCWINTRFLDDIGTNTTNKVVALPDMEVPIYPAPAPATSSEKREPRPKTHSIKLKRGHQVATRRTMTDEDGKWMEIDAPDSEPRYIRAEAVEAAGAADVARTGSALPGGLQRSTAPSANVVSDAEQMRRAAVEADRAGNIAEAVRLYDRISTQFASSYPRLVQASRARAAYLRGDSALPDTPTRTASTSTARSRMADDDRGSSFAPDERQRSGMPRDWDSLRGRIAPASRRGIQNRQLYVLENFVQGRWTPTMYLIGGPGTNLEAYRYERQVEVRGRLDYNDELKGKLMEVRQVMPVD